MTLTDPSRVAADNRGEADYHAKLTLIAERLRAHEGPFVLLSHVDPDGDALGSTLCLKRALEALGKRALLPLAPPRFLAFLAGEGELSPPLPALPDNCALLILDVAERGRALGAPLEGAAFTVNIDHHGTNERFGELSLVEPDKAATAQMVKDLVDALGVSWTPSLATPCLAGIMTDTGIFRYGNTSPSVLRDASELVAAGVDYAALSERLQERHPDYFTMLGRVMSTVRFPLMGLAAVARLTEAMRAEVGDTEDDSSDYVGLIRYAEGVRVAVFLKERDGATKISVRAQGGVSAQAICLELGGGGHVAAAGAKLPGDADAVEPKVLAAVRRELERRGFSLPESD